ncbi:MAG: cytochrome c [Isosphaeraceae bacterium]
MRAGFVSPARAVPVWPALALAALAFASGCNEQQMITQPKYKPLQPSVFFPDGQSSRPVVPGTVARGQLRIHPAFDQGEVDGALVNVIPVKGFDPQQPLDPAAARLARKAVLERGRRRYDVFCAPCHDRVGTGQGMIVQRGFSAPPSFHLDRLREAPPGHYFKAITNGYGAMASYASRIPVEDRWAIVAYVRALQLSQDASMLAGTPGEGVAP